MAGYIPFTDEQIELANSTDLVEFLLGQREKLEKSGNEWRWTRHRGITVRGNEWYDHYSERGSHAIDFLQEFFNKSFPEAVTMLLDGRYDVQTPLNDARQKKSKEKKEFMLPEANPNMRRVYGYLLKNRFINRDVITHFARAKMIYEDSKFHNAIFVGFDEAGIPKHAHKKGTFIGGESFRGNVEGSDPDCSFHHIGTNDTLYVFEAPIDMLSFLTRYKDNWQQHSYVALNCVAEHAMLYVLANHPNIKKIVLCLDHDAPGIEAMGRLEEILQEHGYTEDNISRQLSGWKDWNEDLKAQNGVKAIPAQEHPKIEACQKICSRLPEMCEEKRTEAVSYERIMEEYSRFAKLTENGKVMKGRESVLMGYVKNMAILALVAAKDQYRQIESPVTYEQLIDNLYKLYAPHRDKGQLRSKTSDIEASLHEIEKQHKVAGIRTLEDQRKLISSYMELTLKCVQTHIFIDLEGGKQQTVMQEKQSANPRNLEQGACVEITQAQFIS